MSTEAEALITQRLMTFSFRNVCTLGDMQLPENQKCNVHPAKSEHSREHYQAHVRGTALFQAGKQRTVSDQIEPGAGRKAQQDCSCQPERNTTTRKHGNNRGTGTGTE